LQPVEPLTSTPFSTSDGATHQAMELALARADAVIGAAECHGVLCGMLCGGGEIDAELWLEQVFGGSEDLPAPDAEVVGALQDLSDATAGSMVDAELIFTPLLPGDDAPFAERVTALRDWCEGFLYGYAVTVGAVRAVVSAATEEFVRDVREFTRVDTDAGQGEEPAESALVDVIEYIRIGVLNAHAECQDERDTRPARSVH
jgi:hypothetical protein